MELREDLKVFTTITTGSFYLLRIVDYNSAFKSLCRQAMAEQGHT